MSDAANSSSLAVVMPVCPSFDAILRRHAAALSP
jgi:hypothetical protein